MRKSGKTIAVNPALDRRAFTPLLHKNAGFKGGTRFPAAVLTLPKFRLFWPAEFSLFPLSPALRKYLSAFSIGIAFAAIAIYIAAVNAMLLDGQAINREAKVLARLEQDYAALQSLLVQRQSPAQLQANALENGMVAAAGVRYINSGQPVAFSR